MLWRLLIPKIVLVLLVRKPLWIRLLKDGAHGDGCEC